MRHEPQTPLGRTSCAQIRSDVLRQAAEDLGDEQAQVERHDPLYRNSEGEGEGNGI
jgi:hypothetical protein